MAENKDNTCSICLETIMFPTVLDCGHIFCFLCVKGIAFKSRKCALCRADIPLNFLDNPKLLQTAEELEKNEEENDTQYKWFYEGRNGWWAFESRTNSEIEEAYSNGKKNCVVLIAGYCYIIDFENMMQLRQNQPSKHRKIKRDLATAPKKGIAGIRLSNPETLEVKTDAGHSDNLTQNSDISDASTAILDISDTTTATFDFSDHDEIQLSQELSETLSIIDITEEQ